MKEKKNLFDLCLVRQRGNIFDWNLLSAHPGSNVCQELGLVFAVNQDHHDRGVAVRDSKPFERLGDLYQGGQVIHVRCISALSLCMCIMAV